MIEKPPTMRLSIPAQPPTLNQLMRGTLRQRMRLERDWKQLVAWAATQAEIPKATGKRWVTITVILGPRQHGMDPDAPLKACGDALKACGAIRDDSRQWVGWKPVRYQKGTTPACIIELWEDSP